MIYRISLIWMLCLVPAMAEEPDVLAKLGVKRDSSGRVIDLKAGGRAWKDLVDFNTFKKEILDQEIFDPLRNSLMAAGTNMHTRNSPAESEVSQEDTPPRLPSRAQRSLLPNHRCQRRPQGILPGQLEEGAMYLKEGMKTLDVYKALGVPDQVNWCLDCPIWQYKKSLVFFDDSQKATDWQGDDLVQVIEKTSRVNPSDLLDQNKQTIQGYLGRPPFSAYHHNHWQYGELHIIFSEQTDHVKEVLDFSR